MSTLSQNIVFLQQIGRNVSEIQLILANSAIVDENQNCCHNFAKKIITLKFST